MTLILTEPETTVANGADLADSLEKLAMDINSAAHNEAPAKPHEEYQYLDLIQQILDEGEHRPDR
jgi:hypothetical protein